MASPAEYSGVKTEEANKGSNESNADFYERLMKDAMERVKLRKEAAAAEAKAKAALPKSIIRKTKNGNLTKRKTVQFGNRSVKEYNINNNTSRGVKTPKGSLRTRSPAPRTVTPVIGQFSKKSHGIAHYIAHIEHDLLMRSTNGENSEYEDMCHIMQMIFEVDTYEFANPRIPYEIKRRILHTRGKYLRRANPPFYQSIYNFVESTYPKIDTANNA